MSAFTKYLYITFLAFLSSTSPSAFGIAYQTKLLPTPPVLRPEGVQQFGDTCHAAAFLTALEHHFQRLDKPVKLSLLYFIYSMRMIVDSSQSKNKEAVVYDPRFYHEPSLPVLSMHGSVIPHYMHPEEHRYTIPFYSTPDEFLKHMLPPIEANIPSDYQVGWPTIKSHILSHDLVEGFSMFLGRNIDPIQVLKKIVLENKVAVLGFSGTAVFNLFDEQAHQDSPLKRMIFRAKDEVLLQRELSKDNLDTFLQGILSIDHSEPASHALALVGFDDDLYSNAGYSESGAFILKGTWDDSSHQYISIPYQIIRTLVAANKARALDFVSREQFGPSVYLLNLQILELPAGFEDQVFSQYEKYKSKEEFRIHYFPFLTEVFLAEDQINYYRQTIDSQIEEMKTVEDELQVREEIASLFTPWVSNTMIHVAVVSGAKMTAMVDDPTFSEYYKIYPHYSIFPHGQYFHFLEKLEKDFSYLEKDPSQIGFWQGFFGLGKAFMLIYEERVKQQQQQEQEL